MVYGGIRLKSNLKLEPNVFSREGGYFTKPFGRGGGPACNEKFIYGFGEIRGPKDQITVKKESQLDRKWRRKLVQNPTKG